MNVKRNDAYDDMADPSVFFIFALLVVGYRLRSVWNTIVSPALLFSEEEGMQRQLRQLKRRIEEIPSSNLAQKGLLRRETVFLSKKLQEVKWKRWRYQLSLSSLLFLFDVESCADAPQSIFSKTLMRWCSNSVVRNVVNHLVLLLYYNISVLIALFLAYGPCFAYILITGWFRIVCLLPLTQILFPPFFSHSFECSAWAWAGLCSASINLSIRVFSHI